MVVGAAIGVRYLLRDRPRLNDAVTVGTSAGGLILAGAVLSQNPWRSVDGYAGHSAGVQLLALISVAALAASVAVGGVPQLNTVRGAIDTADLGVTLMHEHVFVLSPEINDNYPEVMGRRGQAGGRRDRAASTSSSRAASTASST